MGIYGVEYNVEKFIVIENNMLLSEKAKYKIIYMI